MSLEPKMGTSRAPLYCCTNSSIGSALNGYRGLSAAGLSYSNQNSGAMFQGMRKSRSAILGRCQAVGTRKSGVGSIKDDRGAQDFHPDAGIGGRGETKTLDPRPRSAPRGTPVLAHWRRYRIAAKSGFRLPSGM